MKKTLLIAVVAATALAGCTQLSEKDRTMLTETHDLAQQAAQDAAAARADADKAAASAKAASEKADRIFRQSQNK